MILGKKSIYRCIQYVKYPANSLSINVYSIYKYLSNGLFTDVYDMYDTQQTAYL